MIPDVHPGMFSATSDKPTSPELAVDIDITEAKLGVSPLLTTGNPVSIPQ